jgi:DNA-binding GntR family transcriptional regulator
MSPGPTFERVYLELKRQLREGTRPPGAPLEPSAIGGELGTSFTPVRDALHRLVGEGLVENPLHNGFAVPRPTEQALRDLYAWNGELLALIVAHAKSEPRTAAPAQAESAGDVVGAAAATFLVVAAATGNREHARAVAQLNERLAPYRRAELQVFADAVDEVAGLEHARSTASRAELARSIARYHKRRTAAVPEILAAIVEN